MQTKLTYFEILAQFKQSVTDGVEGQLIPGDLVNTEELGLETLWSCTVLTISQKGEVEHVNLTDRWYRSDDIQLVELRSRPRFLPGFAKCGLGHCLTIFHKACRECPEPIARFNGALTKQHFVIL